MFCFWTAARDRPCRSVDHFRSLQLANFLLHRLKPAIDIERVDAFGSGMAEDEPQHEGDNSYYLDKSILGVLLR